MFGYIRPCKPEMKVREFDTFQAIYCGLCRQLSHVYGPFASLTLSYDFTFLAAVSLGMSGEEACFKRCACAANPLKKKACLLPCGELSYCASAAMLMIYYKLRDDIADSGFFRRAGCYALLPFASQARKKAARLYPEMDASLSAFIRRQGEVEREGCASLDRAADPTANALAALCEGLSQDERQRRVLRRFGYLVGRYVYFADALDDLEEDKRSGAYNPFLRRYPGEDTARIRERAREALNLTVAEIVPAYELLELRRFKPILDNIVYLGLHGEIDVILTCPDKKKRGKGMSGPLFNGGFNKNGNFFSGENESAGEF